MASDKLPDISVFETHPSDRFPVDLDEITSGHPFKGINSAQPHAEAHVHFDNKANRWPKGGREPARYPAIYAVADGIISRVDFRFGQKIRKGDVLAYLYTPPRVKDSPIHFHLMVEDRNGFLAPAIFSPEIVREFHSKWDGFGQDAGAPIPPCMGYRISRDENPFGTGEMERL